MYDSEATMALKFVGWVLGGTVAIILMSVGLIGAFLSLGAGSVAGLLACLLASTAGALALYGVARMTIASDL